MAIDDYAIAYEYIAMFLSCQDTYLDRLFGSCYNQLRTWRPGRAATFCFLIRIWQYLLGKRPTTPRYKTIL